MAFKRDEWRGIAHIIAIVDFALSIVILIPTTYFLATISIKNELKEEKEEDGSSSSGDGETAAKMYLAVIPLGVQALMLLFQTMISIYFINAFAPERQLSEAVTWTENWLHGATICTLLHVLLAIPVAIYTGVDYGILAFGIVAIRGIFIWFVENFKRILVEEGKEQPQQRS